MKHILNAIFEKIINEIELPCVCVVLCLFWFAYFRSHFEVFLTMYSQTLSCINSVLKANTESRSVVVVKKMVIIL